MGSTRPPQHSTPETDLLPSADPKDPHSRDCANFRPLNDAVGPPVVFDAADLNGDGRLDLIGLSAEGQAQQAINHGSKDYHWQVVRPRATQAVGDQRINPFAVGGEMEIRSGLLVQKQPITGPLIHFGLGDQTSADVNKEVTRSRKTPEITWSPQQPPRIQ